MDYMTEEFGKYMDLERQSTQNFLSYHRGRLDGKLSAAKQIEGFATRTGNETFFDKLLGE